MYFIKHTLEIETADLNGTSYMPCDVCLPWIIFEKIDGDGFKIHLKVTVLYEQRLNWPHNLLYRPPTSNSIEIEPIRAKKA